MANASIIAKLEKSGLTGRGGASFPVATKWKMVKAAKGKQKYIVCNAAEGEPGTNKDGYLLKNYPEEVANGIRIALETFPGSSAYIYLRKDYYRKFGWKLKRLTKGLPVTLFKKSGGYIAGEETCVIETIEGHTPDTRIKPPFPPQAGLYGCPTLINNVETFYFVSQIASGKYKGTRFYSVGEHGAKPAVVELASDATIAEILEEAGAVPEFDFFVQAGGGAMGEILMPDELNVPLAGSGSIIIYNRATTDVLSLLKTWVDFFLKGNCDKCVPCREGMIRLGEMIDSGEINQEAWEDVLQSLEQSSFCALGKGAPVPIRSLTNKMQFFHG